MKLLQTIHEYQQTKPTQPAFVSQHASITYDELWHLSDQMAGAIDAVANLAGNLSLYTVIWSQRC